MLLIFVSDPNDADAKYVHFFHEKIPSRSVLFFMLQYFSLILYRQLTESTTTQTLDELIAANPHRLEFYRTRGVVHCFRDEYPHAIKDFTHALKEARAARKVRTMSHDHSDHSNSGGKSGMRREKGGRGASAGSKKKKGRNVNGVGRTNGQAPPNGTSAAAEDGDDKTGGGGDGGTGDAGDVPLHPSTLPDAPDPIEPQLLFLRGSAYLQQAVRSIELAVLDLEGLDANAKPKEGTSRSKLKTSQNIPPVNAFDTSELRLCYLQESLYGGVEIGNPAGPLGASDGPKVKAYRKVLADGGFREQVISLVKKAIRDYERFLGHFDTLEADFSHEKGKGGAGKKDWKEQTEYAFMLSEATRPGNYPSSSGTSSPYGDSGHFPPPATMFTTYHPLIVEARYAILLSMLMLGEFSRVLPTFSRTAALVDGLEGYPIFLPPRSMAQAEFVEVLERLSSGWKKGAFEDEFALVPVNERRRTASPTSVPTSRTASTYSAAGSSSSRSSSPTTTDLGDDILGSAPLSESSNDIGEGGSSTSGRGSASTFTKGSSTSTPSPTPNVSQRSDAAEALDSLRVLLSPVISRQRERARVAAAEKGKEKAKANLKAVVTKGKGDGIGIGSSTKKSMPINIPLHGPRVEVVLAWLGAVHLPELDV